MLFLKGKETSLEDFKRFDYKDWDELKERISFKLVNKKSIDDDELEDIVYEDCMDLYKIYTVNELSQDRKKVLYHVLKNSELDNFNEKVKKDDVIYQAYENLKYDNTKRIKTLTERTLSREIMYPLMKLIDNAMLSGPNMLIEDTSAENDTDNVLIVSNKYNVFGASYMLDSNTLEEVYKRMKSNFYIVPMSINEIMCVSSKYIKKDKSIDEAEDDLLDMLFEINSNTKDENNILTYKIYYYAADDGKRLFPIKQKL